MTLLRPIACAACGTCSRHDCPCSRCAYVTRKQQAQMRRVTKARRADRLAKRWAVAS